MNENSGYGVITEVGDLGLGFQELNEQDQEVLKKENEKDNNKN